MNKRRISKEEREQRRILRMIKEAKTGNILVRFLPDGVEFFAFGVRCSLCGGEIRAYYFPEGAIGGPSEPDGDIWDCPRCNAPFDDPSAPCVEVQLKLPLFPRDNPADPDMLDIPF